MIKNILSSNKKHIFGYLALSIVVAVCVRTAGDDIPAFRTIEANQFILRDADGKARARLDVFDKDTRMRFFDSNEKTGLSLGVRSDGSSFVYLNNTNDNHAMISMSVTNGVPQLGLSDKDGKPRILLNLLHNNTATINFMDGDKKIKLALGAIRDGEPGIILYDNNGKSNVFISSNNKGVDFFMADNKGKLRISMYLDAAGDPKMLLLDDKGEALFERP